MRLAVLVDVVVVVDVLVVCAWAEKRRMVGRVVDEVEGWKCLSVVLAVGAVLVWV